MTRRHRLHEHEVPSVKEGLYLYLEELLEDQVGLASAEVAFKLLLRLVEHRPGKPIYPKRITWRSIRTWLRANGTIRRARRRDYRPV